MVVSAMFMSEYNHTLDTKGRLIIPAKFREVLGEEFVISKGMDGCLFVYANDDWNAFEQKLTSLPLINKEARQFARFFLAGAATVEVDKQGRILLPAHSESSLDWKKTWYWSASAAVWRSGARISGRT